MIAIADAGPLMAKVFTSQTINAITANMTNPIGIIAASTLRIGAKSRPILLTVINCASLVVLYLTPSRKAAKQRRNILRLYRHFFAAWRLGVSLFPLKSDEIKSANYARAQYTNAKTVKVTTTPIPTTRMTPTSCPTAFNQSISFSFHFLQNKLAYSTTI